jgi:hypothetical protein
LLAIGRKFPEPVRIMITVANCPSIDHALLLKSLLEGCGIPAFVLDELTAQNAPYLFATKSQIRLQVADEDAETARVVLAQGWNGGTD